jgi:hypothetical protein
MLRALDPFIHMDQMGEVDYAPGEPKGTPWHPHRGFETVTYMIDGIFQHQDSNGGGGLITDGDTQWMTAGAVLPIYPQGMVPLTCWNDRSSGSRQPRRTAVTSVSSSMLVRVPGPAEREAMLATIWEHPG